MDEIERKLYDTYLTKSEQITDGEEKEENDDLKNQALIILIRKIYINSRGNLAFFDNFLNNHEKSVLYKVLYKKRKINYCVTYKED